MDISFLSDNIGYIIFTYSDGKSFYIKTSFHQSLCNVSKDDCLYDLLTKKFINKRIFETSSYQVTDTEPFNLKDISNFIKQFL